MLTSCHSHIQASISTCSKARSLTYRWFESSKTIATTSKDPRYFTVAGETHHQVMLHHSSGHLGSCTAPRLVIDKMSFPPWTLLCSQYPHGRASVQLDGRGPRLAGQQQQRHGHCHRAAIRSGGVDQRRQPQRWCRQSITGLEPLHRPGCIRRRWAVARVVVHPRRHGVWAGL